MAPVNPCSGRATHLIFIESRADRKEIRERVRKYLLTDGAQQAGMRLKTFNLKLYIFGPCLK